MTGSSAALPRFTSIHVNNYDDFVKICVSNNVENYKRKEKKYAHC